MERATQCAPQGWAGRLVLAIEGQGANRVLVCRAGDTTTVLFELGAAPASFSYSVDATNWSTSYKNQGCALSVGDVATISVGVRAVSRSGGK